MYTTLTDGNVCVIVRDRDGFVNATKLCLLGGKKWKLYSRRISSQIFVSELAKSSGQPVGNLTEYDNTLLNASRATWVHPQIAIHVAEWLNPDMGSKVSGLLQGQTTSSPAVTSTNRMTDQPIASATAKVTVSIRENDGYINATKLCQSAGKLWGHYYSLSSTRDFLAAAEKSIAIGIHPLNQLRRSVSNVTDHLIDSITTGPNSERGTWVHPQVAIHLAQWLSPEFAVAVTELVLRYSKGEVTTEESQALAADIAAAKRPVPDFDEVTTVDEWNPDTDEMQEHRFLMNRFGHLSGVYLIRIGLNLVKFGMTARSFKERMVEHHRDFPQLQVFGLRPSQQPLALEQLIKSDEMIAQNLTKYTTPNGKTHTEVVALAYPELTKTYLRTLMEDQHALMEADKEPNSTSEVQLEMEKEKTKRVQIEQEEATKREQEKTKQLQIRLEMMRLYV